MGQYVFLIQDDKDEGQIGVGIYPAPGPNLSDEEVDRIRLEAEVIERVYGPSEIAAWTTARLRCREAGWTIVNLDEMFDRFLFGEQGMSRKVANTAPLARVVYEAVYKATDGDLGQVGEDLAYLLGAILKGTSAEYESNRMIVLLLRDAFDRKHPVWKYIVILEEE